MGGRWTAFGLVLAVLMSPAGEVPARPPAGPAAVSIVIDDLGRHAGLGRRAVQLPGRVTCAFLPHAPNTPRLARLAHREGKQVMVHLPMQAVSDLAGGRLSPGTLTLHMTEARFLRTLRRDLAAVPHARGVNNHMGSLLTRHPGHMGWLMNELGGHGDWFFLDSRTTAATVARRIAHRRGVPNAERDVFLDNDRSRAAIEAQLERLMAVAHRRGTAVAIGHPYPETLTALEAWLPRLDAMDVALVPVSRLIALRHHNGRWVRAGRSASAEITPPLDRRRQHPHAGH